MRNYGSKVWIALILLAFSSAGWPDADISDVLRASIEKRISVGHYPGIVIGIVDEAGPRYYGFGRVEPGGTAVPDKDTIYEIGSIGKTFAATVLADMVVKGEVSLNDPVQAYLPEPVSMPRFEDRPITLEHLTTHGSGLPRMPSNFAPADPLNPFADYGVQDLYDYLNAEELTVAPGSRRLYSNVGFGLLGHVLSLSAGRSYEELIRERITQPLAMASTEMRLGRALEKRLAPPYALEEGELVGSKNWDVPVLAGAGGQRSSTADMLRYLAAQLGLIDENPLGKAMGLSQEPRGKFTGAGIGLAWSIGGSEERPIYAHNGGTGGYRTFAGFVPSEKFGVIVMTNSTASVDDIGVHLLVDSFPLEY